MLRNLLFTALVLPMTAIADQSTAIAWLEKMGTAMLDQSYTGTFIYMRGSRFETMRVTHQNQDGEEFERITNISGAEREIVRHGDHAVCIHADQEGSAKPHALPRGPFTHSFNRNLVDNLGQYNIAMHGVGRIAERQAVRISISPKNRDRYGYRLWLDEETGLLLRSNLVDNGHVLELFQFTELSIGESLPAEKLTASIQGEETFQHDLLTPENLMAQNTPTPSWRVNWMPRGFRQVRGPGGGGMVFTDGVATVSVFVEARGRNTLGDVQTSVGGTVVFSRPMGSTEQITVVGEVPIDTAKRVAASVEPVIY